MDLHSSNKSQEEPFVSGIKEDHACLLEEKKMGGKLSAGRREIMKENKFICVRDAYSRTV